MYFRMSKIINDAVKILHDGGVVGFPTDTVYAIAVAADSQSAMEKLYAMKKRDKKKPLQILVDSIAAAKKIGNFSAEALVLAEKYWPGALTIVVPHRHPGKTIGIRIPDHLVALELLKTFGAPLAATSANISGEESAIDEKTAEAALPRGAVDMLIPGICVSGLSSTVIDMTGANPLVLRQGSIIL